MHTGDVLPLFTITWVATNMVSQIVYENLFFAVQCVTRNIESLLNAKTETFLALRKRLKEPAEIEMAETLRNILSTNNINSYSGATVVLGMTATELSIVPALL